VNDPKKPKAPSKRLTARGGETRDDLALAKFTVVDERVGGAKFPISEASVEIVGAPPKNTNGKTNLEGIHRTRVFPRGTYEVIVRAAGMGPVPPPGKPTVLGEFRGKFVFQPLSKVAVNEIEISLRSQDPRIHITVLEESVTGPIPLAGARCEVIGVNVRDSDAKGEFVTRPVLDGKYTVHVKKAGFFPQTQDGDAFFRVVEVTAGGMDSTGSRDVHLTVLMATTKPVDIPPFVPDPIAIWASGSSSPHTVRPDPFVPADTKAGQGGWDLGVQFSSFLELANRLHGARADGDPILDHQVSRLGFVAHGAPGVVDVDQKESGVQGTPTPAASRSLTVARLGHYSGEIEKIRLALRQNSVVILASCQAGDGKDGEALLKALSRHWPTTTVVGLRSIAAVPVGNVDKDVSSNPTRLMYAGVRDTRYANGNPTPGVTRDFEDPAICADLTKLPWASETSLHATVARDGNIVRRGMMATGTP
jgi:hypothetical protein